MISGIRHYGLGIRTLTPKSIRKMAKTQEKVESEKWKVEIRMVRHCACAVERL